MTTEQPEPSIAPIELDPKLEHGGKTMEDTLEKD